AHRFALVCPANKSGATSKTRQLCKAAGGGEAVVGLGKSEIPGSFADYRQPTATPSFNGVRHARPARKPLEQQTHYIGDRFAGILHVGIADTALRHAFPDELLLPCVHDVDVRGADRIGDNVDVAHVQRPDAIQTVAITVVAVSHRGAWTGADLGALTRVGEKIHEQLRILIDIAIAAQLHLFADRLLEMTGHDGRVPTAIRASLLGEPEGAVLGKISAWRRVDADVRRAP